MTLDQAILEIQELKKDNHSFWTRNMLGRWTGWLEELKLFFLQLHEKEMLERELDIHITHIKNEVTKQQAKKELELFLRFLKNQMDIKSYNNILTLSGTIILLLSVILGLPILWCVVAGFLLQDFIKDYLKLDRRVIQTVLHI
jgi:hypothetical protein